MHLGSPGGSSTFSRMRRLSSVASIEHDSECDCPLCRSAKVSGVAIIDPKREKLFRMAGLRPGTSGSTSIYAEQLSIAAQTSNSSPKRAGAIASDSLSPLALVHKNCLEKMRQNRADRKAIAHGTVHSDTSKSPQRLKRGSITLSSSSSPVLFSQTSSPLSVTAQLPPEMTLLSASPGRHSLKNEKPPSSAASDEFVCPISFVTETTRSGSGRFPLSCLPQAATPRTRPSTRAGFCYSADVTTTNLGFRNGKPKSSSGNIMSSRLENIQLESPHVQHEKASTEHAIVVDASDSKVSGLSEVDIIESRSNTAATHPAKALVNTAASHCAKALVPPLGMNRVDVEEQREFIDFGTVVSGLHCPSSAVQQYSAAIELEQSVQWNDLMWPDDKAPWNRSPRHSYLQSCEKRGLLPHPRLLQFPNSILSTPTRPPFSTTHPFVAPFGFVAEHIFLGDAGLDASVPLIQTVLTAGGNRGKQLHLIDIGVTRAGICFLGKHLQAWSSAGVANMHVLDVDFSGNDFAGAPVQGCPIRSLQPILRTPHLQRLVLCGCRLRDYGAVALLKTLCAWEGKKSEDSDAVFIRNLLHNNTGGMRLAIAQREWHQLELLDLSNNGIEEVGGVVVAAIICLGPKLLQCNLDWNSIRGRGALALGQALNNVPQSLRALSLDHNPLGDIGAAAIADALVYNEELHFLSLRYCGIGDVGGALLAYGIRRNQTLVHLNVAHNALGMIGGRSLLRVKRSKMELLQNKSDCEQFVYDDPFLPKPAAAVPSANRLQTFKLVGVVATSYIPVGLKKGDIVIDLTRCSIDFIGAITPSLLNMDNPNGKYELDLSNIRDRAIASELWEFAMREPGENWMGETVDNIKIEISEDPESPWIVPLKGILRVTYVSFPKPPTNENAIEAYALSDLLEKISRSKTGPTVSSKDRLEIIFSVASETFFTSSNITRLLQEFDEKSDRINLILRCFDRCTDFENKKEFLNCLSDDERRLVAKTLGQLYSFQPGYPAGHYSLDLGNRYDRLLATKLQEQANLQNDRANALGLLDSGQLGNGERCWRNVAIDGKDIKYNGRFQIPSRGKLTMDISSIASSFKRNSQHDIFSKTEFEEFICALKESLDAATSANDLNRAYLLAIDTIRSRLLSGKRLTCKMAMAIASLFPEVPSQDFQVLDSTSGSPDAISTMSGSTSNEASRPSTAGSPRRQFSSNSNGNAISMASVVKRAMPQRFVVSAADCLHECHAHVTDPENFWKSINDAYATSGTKQGLVSELGHRLGWLNIFNPMHCDGFYRLDLGKRDQRIVAQMLVILSLEEPGENVGAAVAFIALDSPSNRKL